MGADDRLGAPAGGGRRRPRPRGGRRALRKARAVDLLDQTAARALAEARRQVGRRASAGGPAPVLDADRIAAALEADPVARALLDAAAEAARREDPGEGPAPEPGARAARAARADRAHAAIDHLVVRGALVADGPGRVVVPGFGPSTWRAIALLHRGAEGAEALWAAAVAREPAADLGDEAPAALRALAPPDRLAPLAWRLHACEAARQDMRDALLRAARAADAARARGADSAAAAVDEDCARLEGWIARLDATAAALWDEGIRAAGAAAP